MAQTIHSDMIRKLIAVSMVLGSTSAQAQNCMQYPPGSFRTQCVAANHPQFATKLERCKDEGRAMGLAMRQGDHGLREYVQACMHRR
jgi:hypothetical protein